MLAHLLGRSSDLSVLLGVALNTVQSLGLNRLDYNVAMERITSTLSENQRHKLLRREVG